MQPSPWSILEHFCPLQRNLIFFSNHSPNTSPTALSLSLVTQSCLALCDPMDCSLPGSSIHGIFQASVLEWVAVLQRIFSRAAFLWTDVFNFLGYIPWSINRITGSHGKSMFNILRNCQAVFQSAASFYIFSSNV